MRAQISLLQTALKDLNLELEQALDPQDPAARALALRRKPPSSLTPSPTIHHFNASGRARPSGERMDFSSGDDDEGTNAIWTPRRLKTQNAQLRRDKQRVSRLILQPAIWVLFDEMHGRRLKRRQQRARRAKRFRTRWPTSREICMGWAQRLQNCSRYN